MRTGLKNQIKKFSFPKKGILALVIMALVVCVVGLTTTTVINPQSGKVNVQQATPANIEGEDFELILSYYDSTVGGGNTKLTSIDWDGTNKTEVRIIKQQVTYRDTNVSKSYAPGELVITLTGLNDMYKNQSIDHIANGDIVVAADAADATTKQYDWSYTYDATTNTYTFTNNRAIEAYTNFEGSIQIAYNMEATDITQTNRTDSAWLNNTVQSNDVSLEYTSNKKPYTVSKTASQVTSQDGLPANSDEYIWVRYAFEIDASQQEEIRNLDATKQVYINDTIAQEGCIVLNSNLDAITPNTDGTYSLNLNAYWDATKWYYQYMVVGYPKATYEGQTITNIVDVYGTYQEETTVSYIGQDSIEVDLQYFGFEYTGDLYDMIKDSYPLTEVNYNPAFKGHSVLTTWRIAVGAIYTGTPMTIRVGDDIVGMTLEDGSYVKLEDDEYYFDSVDINFDLFKNGNGVMLEAYKYTCAMYVRYAGTDEFVKYGPSFSNTGGTKTVDFLTDDVVGWYFEIYDVTESVQMPTYWGTYQIEPKLMVKRTDGVGTNGYIYNFDFLEVFFKDIDGNFVKQNEVDLDSYLEEMTQKNIAEYDMETYGKYLQRSFDYVKYKDKLLNLYMSKSVNDITKDLNSEYFYSSFNISYTVNFEDNKGSTDSYFEGYRMYDLLPDGVELDATADEILDSLSNPLYYEIAKSDGTLFQTHQEYKQFIKDHATVTIDKDYKGSGRAYIAIIVDLQDDPIDFINFQGEYSEQFDTYKIPVKVSFDTYLEKGGKYTNYSHYMYIYDSELKNGGYDSGAYNDPLSSDIDNDGSTTDRIVRGTATLNILDAVSSYQDVIKSVKTDLTDGEYWLSLAKATPGTEYEYKLRVRTGESSIKGLIIYDNIETVETTEEKWQGTFVGVSTAAVEEKGFAPVVYYSENSVTGTIDDSDEWKPLTYDSEKELWVTPAGVSSSVVKSIAVDLRKGTDGADVVVGRNSILYCGLVMKAPDEVPPEGVVGRENMCYTNWNAIDEDTGEAIDEIVGINSNKVNVEIDTTGAQGVIEGTKTWEDENNKYGVRPDSITVSLLQNGVVVSTVTTNAENNWAYSFGNWPKYKSQTEKYVYTIEETPVVNYTTTKEDYNLINTIELTEIEASKVWEDNGDANGKRPTSITLELYDGDTLVSEAVVNEANGWKYTFTNLVKYNTDGTEKVYTIDEKTYTNEEFYTKTITDYTITNTINMSAEKIKITGLKVWDDNNDAAGKRPESITLQIKNGNTVVATQVVTAANNWSYEFEVPKYDDNGNEIQYTIDEGNIDSIFYEKELTDATTVTNKFVVPNTTIKFTGTKIWDDNNDAAGKRPVSITLQVKNGDTVVATQVVNETNNWTYTFELPKYDELGNEIQYTIDETGNNKFYEKELTDSTTITNKFTVPDETINFVGTKIWEDNGDAAGKRPESIILQVKNGTTVVAEQEVTAADNWSYQFVLPKYDELGNEIEYTIDEVFETEIYQKELTSSTVVTNKFLVPDTKIDIQGVKVWDDNNNAANKRPTEVTLQLKADGNVIDEQVVNELNGWKYTFEDLPKFTDLGDEIEYVVDEKDIDSIFYQKELVDGTTVVNKFVVPDDKIKITGLKIWDDDNNKLGKRPESVTLQVKDGTVVVAEQVVTEENNWSYEFELPKYDNLGNEIEYIVDEADLNNVFYEKELTSTTTVTNKFSIPDDKIKIKGTKVWADNNDEAGKRPSSIVLQVKNGNQVVAIQEVSEKNGWTYEFELPKYDNLGNEVEYTVDEEFTSIFYEKELTNATTVTNKFSVPDDKIQFTGTKVWIDNNNEAGKRPESIVLQIKNGDEVVATQEVNEANNWTYTFEVPKYDRLGNEIDYTIDEEFESIFYEKELTNPGTVTNTFKVPDEKIEITGLKVWNDNNDAANKRPAEVTLQLKANGNVTYEQVVTELTNWEYTFKDLPKYDELGNEIEYTIDEQELDSIFYEKELTDATTVTNTFKVPDDKIKFTGTKVWADNDDYAGKRPESVILQIKDGNIVVATQKVTAEDNWTYEFEVPKYDELGNEIEYTIDEENLNNIFYEKQITDINTVTNIFKVPDEKIEITGLKTWNDNNNEAGKRLEEITLQVKAGNTVVDEQVVTELTNWEYTFKDLPKYDELGNEIEYTIDEQELDSIFYEKELTDATTVTNTFKVPDDKIKFNGTKVWDDNNNRAEKRPESVELQVKNGDEVVATQEVTAEDNWTYEFEVPKYDELGNEIEYTIDEKDLDSIFYEKEITNDTIITNKFSVPDERLEITGLKVWDDNDNELGKRPEEITLQLKADNNVVNEKVLNDLTGWEYTFKDLPKYDELGNEIEYQIDEKDLENVFYEKELTDATTVTNIFAIPDEKIKFVGTKVWEDNNDIAGKRPESIILQVKVGDNVVAEQEVTAEDNWSYEFELPKYDELGNEIEYTLDEEFESIFYEKELTNGTTVTNKFIVPGDWIRINGLKVWNDNNNAAGKRPRSITLQMKANGEVVAEHVVNEENNWSYEFELPKYDELGNEIEYTLDEKSTGSNFYEKELTNATTVTNTYVPRTEKIDIKGIKVWNDNDNEAGKRPEEITLQLKANGNVIDEKVLNELTGWEYTFKELAKYDELGNLIEYQVDEKDLENIFYEKELTDATTVTNTFVVPDDKIKFTGLKIWNDNNDIAGKRPESTTLQVKNGNEVVAEQEVTAEDNWSYEFELPKYDNLGNEIEYTIDEKDLNNKFYQKELTGDTTVTNTFVVPDEEIVVKAIKKWEDNNDMYKKRPNSIVLEIYVGDKKVAEQKVNKNNDWSYEFTLPKYDELGNEVQYRVDEKETPKYYEKTVEGYTVINTCTYEPDLMELPNTSDIAVGGFVLISMLSVVGIYISKSRLKSTRK